MRVRITPSIVFGTYPAPPSKSATHRALFIASFTPGKSVVSPIIPSDDTLVTIQACEEMGARISVSGSAASVEGIAGTPKNLISKKTARVDCRMSGTTLRLLTALAVSVRRRVVIDGAPRLRERPIKPLVDALQSLQARIRYLQKEGFLPIEILPSHLLGTEVSIDGSQSSQFVSALLLLAPLLPAGLTIKTAGSLVSKPYIDLTWDALHAAGVSGTRRGYRMFSIPAGQPYSARSLHVEGDYSSAGYLAAAAAICGSAVTITNLLPNSKHPDKKILSLLKKMGCRIQWNGDAVTIRGPRALKAVKADIGDCPDSAPTLAAVAAYAKGTSVFTGIAHLKHKESDRLKDTQRVFRRIGVEITAGADSLRVAGKRPKGGTTESAGDHRLAMALAIAGLGSEYPITIRNAEVVSKSWPSFYQAIQTLNGSIETIAD